MKILKIGAIIAITTIFCLSSAAYSSIVYFKKFTFDEDEPLISWNKMILNGEVNYIPIKQGNEGFLKALSNKACSALYYRLKFKLGQYPLLSWKWRVLKFPDLSDVLKEKDKDDYAARVYVVFPFLSFSTSKFIEYVWAENLPVGAIMQSPAANNVKLIVARNGKAANEWVSESRNVYEDYIKAFGEKPRLSVGAVAVMCDADNSKTEAESLFDDIAISTQEGVRRRLD